MNKTNNKRSIANKMNNKIPPTNKMNNEMTTMIKIQMNYRKMKGNLNLPIDKHKEH
jgi:hypothetical protein